MSSDHLPAHKASEPSQFRTHLQEFNCRISLMAGLSSNGKLELAECYARLESLWQELEQTYWAQTDQPPLES